MRVLKADKRRDILYLLIEGLWVSAKAAGSGIFKRCQDVIVSLALLIIAAPASALRLLSARSLIWSSTAQQPVGLERCMVERESSALDARDAIKRVIDVLGASLLLVLFAPLMALIALIVKRSSPGPAIFRHRCLGLGGREYVCYKFRSMVESADEILLNSPELRTRFDKDFKLKNDPRLTPFGALIRKTSLDELPQLFNVLNGTMSLIGPRPSSPGSGRGMGRRLPSSCFRSSPDWGASGRFAGEAIRRTSRGLQWICTISVIDQRCWT